MKEHPEVYRLEIPARLDVNAAAKRLLTGKTGGMKDAIAELAETALQAARPVGLYRAAHARTIHDDKVEIDGVVFKSKVLNKLLKGQDAVIPFIVTIGKELDEMQAGRGDMMKQFYLDAIKTMIVASAVDYLKKHVQKEYSMPKAALMNPGEIEDWYITEQKPLFSLFGDAAAKSIGVTLTGTGVMKPLKSRSGIIFANESGFETCQLCTQFKCPGRRCKFEPELYRFYLEKEPKIAGK